MSRQSKDPLDETAWDWYQRSTRRKRRQRVKQPHSAESMAWNFMYGHSGVSYIDAGDSNTPLVHLYGNCKTWTLVTLACNYVVQTRASRWTKSSSSNTQSSESNVRIQPIVLFCDAQAQAQATPEQFAHVVRSLLLKEQNGLDATDIIANNDTNADSFGKLERDDAVESDKNEAETFRQDMIDCLGRIQYVKAQHTDEWVALLEIWRYKLTKQAENKAAAQPVLLLWDNFMFYETEETDRNEIWRQVQRLLPHLAGMVFSTTVYNAHTATIVNNDDTAGMLTKTTSSIDLHRFEWAKDVSNFVCLEKSTKMPLESDLEQSQVQANVVRSSHAFKATVFARDTSTSTQKVPFSVSLAGILS